MDKPVLTNKDSDMRHLIAFGLEKDQITILKLPEMCRTTGLELLRHRPGQWSIAKALEHG